MSSKQATWKECSFLRLCGGPNDGTELEIAPTMKNLTYGGERYFRMPDSRAIRDGEDGGCYLWDRYWDADQVAARLVAAAPFGSGRTTETPQ